MKNKFKDNNFGHYLEEFQVGHTFKHWPGKTITESDNNLFTLITMNHHPLHIDAEYCSTTQHKQILVVGTLVFSLVVGLTVRDISGKAIANLNYEQISHDGPIFIGDTLYAETEVLEKRESLSKKDRGIIYVETRAFNQAGKKVLTFRRNILIPKRPK
ncbi:MaoC family dehydratase [Bacteroidota bacterium]